MSDSTEIILHPESQRTPGRRRRPDDTVGPPPAIVTAAGAGAEFAWDEFFKGRLANAHTRKNYAHAVRHFLGWCDHPDRQVSLVRITPGHVGEYLAGLELATPTKKLRLAALRKFFDLLVVRHVVVLNPAASVGGRTLLDRRGQDARDRHQAGPRPPGIDRSLRPRRPPGSGHHRRADLHGRPRRRRGQADDKEPPARRVAVFPAVLRERRQVTGDPRP